MGFNAYPFTKYFIFILLHFVENHVHSHCRRYLGTGIEELNPYNSLLITFLLTVLFTFLKNIVCHALSSWSVCSTFLNYLKNSQNL